MLNSIKSTFGQVYCFPPLLKSFSTLIARTSRIKVGREICASAVLNLMEKIVVFSFAESLHAKVYAIKTRRPLYITADRPLTSLSSSFEAARSVEVAFFWLFLGLHAALPATIA